MSSSNAVNPLASFQFIPGQLIKGQYRLVRPLGRGATSEVWLCLDDGLQFPLALKLACDLHRMSPAQAQKSAQRFQREAALSAKLGAITDKVIYVHEAGVADGTPFLVMEYVRGCTLSAELRQNGVLDPARFGEILSQIAAALDVAHRMGIVHRDIKPSNIMLREVDGTTTVKVADFGVATQMKKAIEPRADSADVSGSDTSISGSLSYMSPEQCRGAELDQRSDVWALGVVAYQVLTGELPFEGYTPNEVAVSICMAPFTLPSQRRPSLPSALDDWFKCALAKDPQHRFLSVQEMAEAYQLALKGAEERRTKLVFASGVMLMGMLLALILGLGLRNQAWRHLPLRSVYAQTVVHPAAEPKSAAPLTIDGEE